MIMLLSTTQFLSDAEHNVDRYDETENLAQYDETGKIYSFTTKDYTNNSMFQTALKEEHCLDVFACGPKGLIKEFIRKYLDLNRTIFQFYL